MHSLFILFLTIFIVSCDARSRSEYQRALGHANTKISRMKQSLNQAHADCSKFKS